MDLLKQLNWKVYFQINSYVNFIHEIFLLKFTDVVKSKFSFSVYRHELWRVEAVEEQSGIGSCVTSDILLRFSSKSRLILHIRQHVDSHGFTAFALPMLHALLGTI